MAELSSARQKPSNPCRHGAASNGEPVSAMSFYSRWILPPLLDWSLRNRDAAACRRRVIPLAHGTVLEIGIGSGLNLPYYGEQAERIVGLDPSVEMLRRALRPAAGCRCPVHLVQASAEAIPLRTGSVDAAVMTWTLCSIPDAPKALREVRRVLRPDGRLLFVEHGLAPEPRVERWQRRLDPLWTRISCHLDRPVDRLLEEAEFEILRLETGYLGSGPKALTFMYEGCARPRR